MSLKKHLSKSLNTATIVTVFGCVQGTGAHAQAQSIAPGTKILNTAAVTYGLSADASPSSARTPISQLASAQLTTFVPHPVAIAIGAIGAPGAGSGASDFTLSAGAGCMRGAQLVNTPPTFVSRAALAAGDVMSFQPATMGKSGDALFVEVFDDQSNRNGKAIETIDVTLSTQSGDAEVIRLVETAPDSGRFIGFVQTARANASQNDCRLSVTSNQRITATYSQAGSSSTDIAADILVDPVGVIFDSVSGEVVDGVTVTLIDLATGQPAEVFGDDGKSAYPSTMKSGTAVTDSSGTLYPAVKGQFRFPLVRPGSYRLQVDGGRERAFPSQFGLPELLDRFADTHFITASSLGAPFVVSMGLVQVDVPVDSTGGKLLVSKIASSAALGVGDFVQYTVSVTNRDARAVQNVAFHDRLPAGLRLQPDSFRVDGVKAKPVQSGPSEFSFPIGTLAPGANVVIRYVTQITPQTALGTVTNLANATGVSAVSNDAYAQIRVRDDLLSDRMVLIGHVSEIQSCGKPGKSVPAAKILFETGDYVVTDAAGAWHMDKLRVGGHVARLDTHSLPEGYEPVLCENDADAAASATSRFVRGTSASLKRIDFYIKKSDAKIEAEAKALAEMLQASVQTPSGDSTGGSVSSDRLKEQIGVEDGKAGTQVTSLHAQFAQVLTPDRSFLFPGPNFSPTTTAVGVAISAPIGESVVLYVNDVETSSLSFDGSREIEQLGAGVHYWSNVALREGMNHLQARFFKNGEQVGFANRGISFSSNITTARVDSEKSHLLADGRSPIVLSVALMDEFGRPAYKGLTGSFNVEGGFAPFVDRAGGAPTAMLGRLPENQTTFTVGEGGIAKIKLEPASNGGEALITLQLKDKRLVLRPWIKASNQPWVVVGFAEGTLAHQKISKAMKEAPGGADLVETGGRVAFYAKGTIGTKTLATIAYDSRGERREDDSSGAVAAAQTTMGAGANADVFDVYGDQSLAQRDAARSGKLYVRIERDRFYAMFGRTQSGLSVTDLTKYDRVINGLKSAYKSNRYDAVGFASEVTGLHQVSETPAEILSGAYMAKGSIKIGSETVSIITRSSTQRDRVLDRKVLQRYIDYDIDYALGAVRLKQAPAAYDIGFNPVFVRIEYDTDESAKTGTVAGGRVAIKAPAEIEGLEIGLSAVSEQGATKSTMGGLDIRYASADGKISGVVEGAGSRSAADGKASRAEGISAQAQYRGEKGAAQIFYKRVEPNFGNGTMVAADAGIEKFGTDGSLQINEGLSLTGSLVAQRDLSTGVRTEVAEGKLQAQLNERTSGSVGLKHQVSAGVAGASAADSQAGSSSTAALFGVQHKVQGLPVRLSSQLEIPDSVTDLSPRRLRVGAEYDLLTSVTLVADREQAQYKTVDYAINRLGLRAQPWTGGQLQASSGTLAGSAPNSFYRLGVDQSVELGKGLTLGLGYGKQAWSGALPKLAVPAGSIVSLESYKSYRLSLAYRNETLVAQTRAEHLDGLDSRRDYLQGDVYRKLNSRYALAAGFSTERLQQGASISKNKSLKITGSYRDASNPYSGLASLRFVETEQSGTKASSVVFNAMQNYKLSERWEAFGHQGIKRAGMTFDGEGYLGWSYLVNAGLTYRINPSWDTSVSALRAYAVTSRAGSQGVSTAIGHVMAKDARLEVGYQHLNRFDRNFAFSDAYVNGFFLRVALKFDENTFGLNRKAGQAVEVKPN